MSKKEVKEEIKTKELIVHEKPELMEMYSQKGGMKPVLDRLKEVAMDFTVDLSTQKGRDLVASQAYAVSKSKTFLENLGKEITQDWREKTTRVNSTKNDIKAFCDELRDEIRKPLTEYEALEKKKVAELKAKLKKITDLKYELTKDSELSTLKEELAKLEAMDVENDSWGEVEFEAFKSISHSIKHLKTCISDREKFDEDQAELKRLKDEAEKRAKEDKIREEKEAEEKRIADAKIKEEARIAQEKKDEEARIKKAKDDEAAKKEEEKRIALEKKDKEQKAEIDRINKEKQDAKDKEESERKQKEQAQKDKIESDKRAKDAEARLKAIEDDNKAKEAQRIKDEESKQRQIKELKEQAAKDERDNKKAVHNLMLDCFTSNGFSEEDGKKIVTLIGTGKIVRINIDYSGVKVSKSKEETTTPSFKL